MAQRGCVGLPHSTGDPQDRLPGVMASTEGQGEISAALANPLGSQGPYKEDPGTSSETPNGVLVQDKMLEARVDRLRG